MHLSKSSKFAAALSVSTLVSGIEANHKFLYDDHADLASIEQNSRYCQSKDFFQVGGKIPKSELTGDSVKSFLKRDSSEAAYADFKADIRDIMNSESPEFDLEKRGWLSNYFSSVQTQILCIFSFAAKHSWSWSWGKRDLQDDELGELFANIIALSRRSEILDNEDANEKAKREIMNDIAADLCANILGLVARDVDTGIAKREFENFKSDFKADIRDIIDEMDSQKFDLSKRGWLSGFISSVQNQISCIFNSASKTSWKWSWGKREVSEGELTDVLANVIALASRSEIEGKGKREELSDLAAQISASVLGLFQRQESNGIDKRSLYDVGQGILNSFRYSVPDAYFTVSDVVWVKDDLYKVTINFESIESAKLFNNFQDELKTLSISGVGIGSSEILMWDGSSDSKVDDFSKWSSTILVKAEKHDGMYCMPHDFTLNFDWNARPTSVLHSVWSDYFDTKYKYTLSQDFENLFNMNKDKNSIDKRMLAYESPLYHSGTEFDISALSHWKASSNELPNFCWSSKCSTE